MHDNSTLKAFLRDAKKIHVAIVGDIMLDIFSYGTITRTSPEAPVPIIDVHEKDSVPGGAANVARNVVDLGSRATLYSVTGRDEGSLILRRILRTHKIATRNIIKTPRPTTVKERIVVDGKHHARIDSETKQSIHRIHRDNLIYRFKRDLATIDVLVFADYAKGVITEPLVAALCNLATHKGIPIVVDTKPSNAVLFRNKNISLFTPNLMEALSISQKKEGERAARHLQDYFASSVLITRGDKGMTLYEGDNSVHADALAAKVVDVSGCGDTVAAFLAIALASQRSKTDAMHLANRAAGIVVQKKGTASVSPHEFLHFYEK